MIGHSLKQCENCLLLYPAIPCLDVRTSDVVPFHLRHDAQRLFVLTQNLFGLRQSSIRSGIRIRRGDFVVTEIREEDSWVERGGYGLCLSALKSM